MKTCGTVAAIQPVTMAREMTKEAMEMREARAVTCDLSVLHSNRRKVMLLGCVSVVLLLLQCVGIWLYWSPDISSLRTVVSSLSGWCLGQLMPATHSRFSSCSLLYFNSVGVTWTQKVRSPLLGICNYQSVHV